MSRGLMSESGAELRSGLPVSGQIPGLFLEDPLYLAFCAAIDDLLGPDLVALDCFGAYLDPRLAPTDYLPWLANLVGALPQAQLIADAVATHADRGTVHGLRSSVSNLADVPLSAVSVIDGGGVSWSAEPSLRADAVPTAVIVRVTIAADRDRDGLIEELRSLVAQEIPAHCSFDVEVVQ